MDMVERIERTTYNTIDSIKETIKTNTITRKYEPAIWIFVIIFLSFGIIFIPLSTELSAEPPIIFRVNFIIVRYKPTYIMTYFITEIIR